MEEKRVVLWTTDGSAVDWDALFEGLLVTIERRYGFGESASQMTITATVDIIREILARNPTLRCTKQTGGYRTSIHRVRRSRRR